MTNKYAKQSSRWVLKKMQKLSRKHSLFSFKRTSKISATGADEEILQKELNG